MWADEIQPTVVTRAEPHNLQVVHPTQSRVVTVRENARAQGFPDHYVFVGVRDTANHPTLSHLETRYTQVGNAVAPVVASALGARAFPHPNPLAVPAAAAAPGWRSPPVSPLSLPHPGRRLRPADAAAHSLSLPRTFTPASSSAGRCLRLAAVGAALRR